MKPKVYLETTIISYLTSRPSRNLRLAEQQAFTREWWAGKSLHYELFASDAVVEEITRGDQIASRKRMEALNRVALLSRSSVVRQLAITLIREGSFPPNAEADAEHLALAAVNGMNFLLTWNCKHLANRDLLPRLYRRIEKSGYNCPVVCTPLELPEVTYEGQ